MISAVFVSYVMTEDGFVPIPASRSDIFKDRTLTAMQKRKLTAFLQSAVELLERQDQTQVTQLCEKNSIETECSLQVQDFDAWLTEQGFDDFLLQMVKTGVCFVEEFPGDLAKFEALGYYLQSAGRLRVNSGPFIVPCYSCSDIPQVTYRDSAHFSTRLPFRPSVVCVPYTVVFTS